MTKFDSVEIRHRKGSFDTYSLNLVNFGPGVTRYHVATCNSPSLLHLLFIRPHCSITYVDVAYCYRPSSLVCLSLCLSVTIVTLKKQLKQPRCRLGWGVGWAQGTMGRANFEGRSGGPL